jgi:hypothetical protein
MPGSEIPPTGTAPVHVLHEGYARESGGEERVASIVTLITDGDVVIRSRPIPRP